MALTLVEPNITHLQDLYNITKDVEIMKYVGNLQPWTYEKTKRFIEYGPSDNYYYKAIIINNVICGIIGIYRNKTSYYNLTIFLAKNKIGKGIASAALKLFLSNINKDYTIFADVLNTNTRSINFFKKLGYKFAIMRNIYRFKIQ